MPTPKTPFGFPTKAPAPRRFRIEIQRPTLGLHAGEPASNLMPGFTPEAQNFVAEAGGLVPRSGLSRFGDYSFDEPVLGGAELPDSTGNLAALAASSRSIVFFHPSGAAWSDLSYVRGSTLLTDDLLSGTSTDYWRAVAIFDGVANEYMAVLSNGVNHLKWLNVVPSTSVYSDFTWASEIEGTQSAAALAAINDRLVLFNTTSEDGRKFPTRLVYSARGNPRSFQVLDGAGAIDIMDMRGEGTAAVQAQGQLILFTTDEIWRAVPTLDDYAFRTPERVSDRLGCPYPRTIVVTPLGVVFLGRDLEVYALVGPQLQVMPLGPVEPGRPSRVQAYLRENMKDAGRAWATYNARERRYELYFPGPESTEGFATRALYYSLEEQSWLPQKFEKELTFGFELQELSKAQTWDDMAGVTWDELSTTWRSLEERSNERFVTVFDHEGKIYRMRSDQTNDDGQPIDARWKSHVLNANVGRPILEERKKHVTEIWVEYESENTASLGIHLAKDIREGFSSSRTVTLEPEGRMKHVAVWATGQSPVFEVRVNDGTKPKITGFLVGLTDAGKF